MIASKTRPRARGVEPIVQAFWIVSAVACAALTLAVSAPVFAQTPDPAAAARAKAEAERKARCDPMMAEYRSLSARSAAPRSITENFNSAAARFDDTRKRYAAIRDAGNHVGAWQMIPTLDDLWAKLKTANDTLVAARTARLNALSTTCAAISGLIANGCITAEAATSCANVTAGVRAELARSQARIATLSKTWKTAADEKLNPANAQKGCPIAKTIAPRATVTAVSGRVFIVRGVRTLPATVGTALHAGDVVSVEAGGTTALNLFGAGIIRIDEKTKFEIPNPATAAPPPGIAAQAWTKAKQLIQGEGFERPTPTACTGSRG